MVLPRPTVLRGFAPARLLRAAPRTANRAVSRRGYASSHGGHAEPSSDLPWAIAAVAVTLPTCFYLWPSQTHAEAHHPETAHERAEKLTHEADEPTPEEDKPAQGDTATKQGGLSNDETAHSTPVSENPEKSKKGDGSADTAKAEGTVDSEGPLAKPGKTESNDKPEEKSEEKPEEKKSSEEEKPEEKSEEKSEEKKEEKSEEKKEEKSEEKKDDKPEEKSDDKPEEKKDDKPEEKKKDE